MIRFRPTASGTSHHSRGGEHAACHNRSLEPNKSQRERERDKERYATSSSIDLSKSFWIAFLELMLLLHKFCLKAFYFDMIQHIAGGFLWDKIFVTEFFYVI